jgi:hypothetical protein
VNWLVFIVLAWVFLGLEQGLRDGLTLGSLGMAPSFVFVLLTFVAMAAPRVTVFWCAAAVGIAMDLLFQIPMREGTGTVTIVGPHAIAYGLACQLVLALRGVMMRRNPFTLGFLAMVGSAVAYLVISAVLTLRHATGAPIAWEAKRQLLAGLGSALYTGLAAVPMALLLFPLAHMLGLPDQKARWGGATRR